MAYNKKYPKIQRTNGPYPRNRYGVRFDSITKQQRRLLLEHPIIAERAQSDQFLHIIFEVCRHRHVDRFDKFYYDWSTDSFMKIEELKESYDLIPELRLNAYKGRRRRKVSCQRKSSTFFDFQSYFRGPIIQNFNVISVRNAYGTRKNSFIVQT